MREQEQKLANVKKSCDVVRKVCKVFSIILIVATVLVLISAILMMTFRNDINSNLVFDQVTKEINIVGDTTGGFVTMEEINMDIRTGIFSFNYDGSKLLSEGKIAELFALECVAVTIICAIMAGIFLTIQKTFELIKNSDTPFDEKVLKRLKVVFIAMTIVFLALSGIGTALISGVIFWSIYCILDYGYILQKESDETL